MELDFLMEGTYSDLLSLLPILIVGYVGFFSFAAISLYPLPTTYTPLTVDVLTISSNVNRLYIEIFPFDFLRVFLSIKRIKSSPDPFIRCVLSCSFR